MGSVRAAIASRYMLTTMAANVMTDGHNRVNPCVYFKPIAHATSSKAATNSTTQAMKSSQIAGPSLHWPSCCEVVPTGQWHIDLAGQLKGSRQARAGDAGMRIAFFEDGGIRPRCSMAELRLRAHRPGKDR